MKRKILIGIGCVLALAAFLVADFFLLKWFFFSANKNYQDTMTQTEKSSYLKNRSTELKFPSPNSTQALIVKRYNPGEWNGISSWGMLGFFIDDDNYFWNTNPFSTFDDIDIVWKNDREVLITFKCASESGKGNSCEEFRKRFSAENYHWSRKDIKVLILFRDSQKEAPLEELIK